MKRIKEPLLWFFFLAVVMFSSSALAQGAKLVRSISVSSPAGVAVDGQGNIHVSTDGVIKKYSKDGGYLGKYGDAPGTDADLWLPAGLAVDTSGNINVVDSFNNCVKRYTPAGVYLGKVGAYGDSDGQFNFPTNIAFDSQGYMYVVDTGHDRIQKFTAAGAFVTKWGTPGTGPGQFTIPEAIAIDSNNVVYVSDTGAGDVLRFTTSGVYVNTWDAWVDAKGTNWSFGQATGMCATNNGHVYIVGRENDTVHLFRTNFMYVGRIGRTTAQDQDLLPSPQAVTVGPDGLIYVAADGGIFIFQWSHGGSGALGPIMNILLF